MQDQQEEYRALSTICISGICGALSFIFLTSHGLGLFGAIVLGTYVFNIAAYFAAEILRTTPDAFKNLPQTRVLWVLVFALIPLNALFVAVYLAWGMYVGYCANQQNEE